MLAQEEARLLNHSFIGTEHILLGLIQEGGGIGAQALESLGISYEAVREKVEETIGVAGVAWADPGGSPPFTPHAKKVLELSLREALQLGHSYIGTEHMLLGLVREGEGVAATIVVNLGPDLGRVRQEVINLMSGGQESIGNVTAEDVQAAPRPPFLLPVEPCCPRCRASVSEAARFRSMAVPSEDEDSAPLAIVLVYCLVCGNTLDMFRAVNSD